MGRWRGKERWWRREGGGKGRVFGRAGYEKKWWEKVICVEEAE